MSESQKEKTDGPQVCAIKRITVAGYKSICDECSISLKPLTILAGANSSGKSSMLQPLLLLKQTLDASYDPGGLRLMGPNVRYSSGEQLVCKVPNHSDDLFRIKIVMDEEAWECSYKRIKDQGFAIHKISFTKNGKEIDVTPGIANFDPFPFLPDQFPKSFFDSKKFEWKVVRNRCFVEISGKRLNDKSHEFRMPLAESLAETIRGIIHLPGLRGNPERTYPVTAVGDTFPGTFHEYTASIIASWQTRGEDQKLKFVSSELAELGLTWKVVAIPENDTQVQLSVGRLTHPLRGGAKDLVSIADVGLGVSQTLPVLVALHVAKAGQIVFLEQPEIHLHPRAQMALAEVVARAANRGIVVIVETHSSIILRGIQTAVACGRLDHDKVSLNWFKRDDLLGRTQCIEGELDKAGTFGGWPEDFDEIALESERRFMDANESVQDYNKPG